MKKSCNLKLKRAPVSELKSRNDDGENCLYVSPKTFEEESIDSNQELVATLMVDGVEKIFKIRTHEDVEEGEVECSQGVLEYINGSNYYLNKIIGKEFEFNITDKIDYSRDIDKAEITLSLSNAYRYRWVSGKGSLDEGKIIEKIKENLPKYLLNKHYDFNIRIKNDFFNNYHENYIDIKCSIKVLESKGKEKYGKITKKTKFDIELNKKNNIKRYFNIKRKASEDLLANINYDWTKLGVGGLKKQIKQIIDQIFLPRRMPKKDLDKYGGKFSKGVLLYGPPGTGKTLIARRIAEQFTKKDNIVIIEGSELKSKWVGQSGENLRNVFAKAEKEWKEKGEKSQLHIIIFDEIEALIPSRGSRGDNTGVSHDLITTLLTKLDGAKTQNKNIVVFGLTNRKDMIDDAALRPGRLGLHIKVGLPDEAGRLQILKIHTKALRESGLLGKDVNLEELAKRTENWSGAELADLVTKARNYAIANNFETDNKKNKITYKKNGDLATVSLKHFNAAFKYINPQYKGNIEKLNELLKNKFHLHSDKLKKDAFSLKKDIRALNLTSFCSLAIFGNAGTGKTSLAAKIANEAGATCIEIIQAKDLCMLNEKQKYEKIDDAFERASKGKFSIVVLDDLEGMLGASKHGNFSPKLKIYLEKKLNKANMEKDKKLLIVTTCRDKKLFEALFGKNAYNAKIEIGEINKVKDLISLLSSFGVKVKKADNLDDIKSKPAKEWLYIAKKYMFINKIKKDDGLDIKDFLEETNSFIPPGGDNSLHQYTNKSKNDEDMKPYEQILSQIKKNLPKNKK